MTPCRPKYDLAADKYFLLVWRRQAVEKISVEDLNGLRLSDETIPSEVDDLLKRFYASNVAERASRLHFH